MTKRALRIFAPFLLVLFVLLIANQFRRIVPQQGRVASNAEGNVKVVATKAPRSVALPSPEPMLTATTKAATTPKPIEPLPVSLATLTGPPSGSVFPVDADVSFYWSSDFEVEDGQQFAIVLTANGREVLAGTVDASNLGRNYQVRLNPASMGVGAGSYDWELQLLNAPQQEAVWHSPARPIIFAVQ